MEGRSGGTVDGRFIIREVIRHWEKAAGAWFTTIAVEEETDGPAGITIVIPDELPLIPYIPPRIPPGPVFPPNPGGGGTDEGRRIIGTDAGVYVTDNIGATTPYSCYVINN